MEFKLDRKMVVASFLLTPIIASLISTIHIVHFFALGNPTLMSYLLAITFEVGSVASFVALSVLDRIKKGIVMFIFTILFFMQLVGNVYFSFEYVNQQLAIHGSWLNSFIELVKPLYDPENPNTYKFILSLVIGVPIPLISLSFLKSLVDYLHVDDKKETAVPVAQAIPESVPAAKDDKSQDDNRAQYASHH
jgi:hypothetical protein